MTNRIKNFFLSGSLHSGKSSVLNKIITNFAQLKIGGFRTIPIYQNNQKTGFGLQSLDEEEKCFAHLEMNTDHQFYLYKFDYQVFDDFGVSVLEAALVNSDVILMDEIGLMEQEAAKFCQAIIKCLNAPQLVIGVCQQRADWFLKILQARDDTRIFFMDKNNRDNLTNQIVAMISQFMPLKSPH